MRNRGDIWIVAMVAALLVAYTLYEVNKPKPTDWRETFDPEAKSPYGTLVARAALPEMFDCGKVARPSRGMLAHIAGRAGERREIYFLIGGGYRVTREAWGKIRAYAEEGNIVFMAANTFPEVVLDSLFLRVGEAQGARDFINRPEERGRRYAFGEKHRYFVPQEGFAGETLGYAGTEKQPNYVRIRLGQGWVYLHANPLAFTNYYILDSLHGDYYAKAWSFLPREADAAWDVSLRETEVMTGGPLGETESVWIGDVESEYKGQSLLRVVLDYPGLRWAYILVLAAGALYLLFRSKREQRAIPVMRPPENRTLEFVAVVGSLYYKEREHAAIARKRVAYFLEEARGAYRLDTETLDEEFARLLSERSGVELEKAREATRVARELREAEHVTARQLRELMKCMAYFKHK